MEMEMPMTADGAAAAAFRRGGRTSLVCLQQWCFCGGDGTQDGGVRYCSGCGKACGGG
ncbi:hypothetical protein DEO72_LG4g759 [Vigna unguiculata]|uniref:Uncharacterized protein n=1 Tax=Vigna unguiculata TaxID=3917 RepID=A0A4D6LLY8_VIGUN|nr:hypothetical protein DEO72_LG4g759 [Vigna unguiculata]